jgi:hypothetical protein
VNEIYILLIQTFIQQWPFHIRQTVPAHVRDFQVNIEFLYRQVKNTQAGGIPFLRMPAHQLHTQANAQNGLLQFSYEQIKIHFSQVRHGSGSFSHSGKDHFIGGQYLIRIIRYGMFNIQPLQRIADGFDIAGVVFYDGDFHWFVFLLFS